MIDGAEILVVRYNQPDLERDCIRTVAQHTDLGRHNIRIVDNWQRRKRLGALWNELIEQSPYRFICLLNSDTEATHEGWLDRLVETCDANPGAVVSCMTDKCGTPQQVGEAVRTKEVAHAGTLSGFCLVFERETWRRSGGFREDYPFYGQESNWVRRCSPLLIRRDVFVHHRGSGSSGNAAVLQEERELGRRVDKTFGTVPAGAKVAVLGSGEGNPFPLWRGVDDAVREWWRDGVCIRHLSKGDPMLERRVAEFEPDFAIMIETKRIRPDALTVMESLRCPRALWFNDLRPPEGWGEFDHLFLCWDGAWGDCDTEAWRAMHPKAAVHYMPQGCEVVTELAPRRVGKWEPSRLIFVGSTGDTVYHGDRAALFGQMPVRVYNGQERAARVALSEASAWLYRESGFCVAVSPPAPHYNSLRLYNILAHGGFALLREFPGRERLFRNRWHLAAFKDAGEAMDLVRYYEGHPEEYEAVRDNGWRRAQALHTVSARIGNMVSVMAGTAEGFWGEL